MSLPVVDLDVFLNDADSEAAHEQCKKAADALVEYGALVNQTFLDLLEDYFSQPTALLRADERPEVGYQVGVTLENTEKPKCASSQPCLAVIAQLAPAERPLDLSGHAADPKCRFFWKMQTPPPYATAYPSLNMPNVVPKEFACAWPDTLNRWGERMKDAVEGVAEMAAVGFGLERELFKDAGQYGPHLLAPTASDLRKYGTKNTILAGFHTDLNFLTIHGRSRYPGLHIWARNTGKRIAVGIPPGCLLVQAGRQLEHLSGGLVKAGYHEVVVNDATLQAMDRIRHTDRPLIRISSTFFYHLSSDFTLRPIPQLEERAEKRSEAEGHAELGERESYEVMKVGQQVEK
ncbi:Clavaminate synthase-like protein [Calocera cornea HHB12733]|uniref:Clavaminate synthase-like protein n=1 Tax=Calocera cornea HHB12733 TaxID=1353952 RepID=A0A165DIZ6_9BASI|nr:Clavaminate synthase-like protein [Calocera cornea HHB12733]